MAADKKNVCPLYLLFLLIYKAWYQQQPSPLQVYVLTMCFLPSTWEFSETQDVPMYRILTLVWVYSISWENIFLSVFPIICLFQTFFSLRECTGYSTNISLMLLRTTKSSRKSFNFFSHLVSELRKKDFGDFYQFLPASLSLLLLMRFPTRFLSDG